MFDDSSNDSGSRSEDSEYNPEVFDGSSDEDQAEDKAGTPDEDEGVVVVRRGQKKTKRTGVQWRSNAQYLAALDSVEHERLPTALATVDVKKKPGFYKFVVHVSKRIRHAMRRYVRITLHSDFCMSIHTSESSGTCASHVLRRIYTRFAFLDTHGLRRRYTRFEFVHTHVLRRIYTRFKFLHTHGLNSNENTFTQAST